METWRVTNVKFQAFINRCHFLIFGIRQPLTISNEALWEATREEDIATQIARKW
jgi:hypothetical protein